jgi:ubiquinone/menaquinone biosynthesis C-methylase UbiE
MERIPEQDLMDSIEQAKAYAEADFSEPHNAFVEHFKLRFPDFVSGNVLDLGCGTADVIIRFARSFPRTKIFGVDGAQAMLDIGLQNIKHFNLSHQIQLHRCILPDTRLSDKQFDAVISNSLLHHLKDPFIMWDTVKNCAREHAPIFIMDLFRPDSKERAREIVHLYAADAPKLLQKDFYNSLLAAYTIEEIYEQIEISGLENNLTVETVSDRHIIIWGKNG